MINREQFRKFKKMSRTDAEMLLTQAYRMGYLDGLREGESEYDDAVIVDIDEAADMVGEDVIKRLLG